MKSLTFTFLCLLTFAVFKFDTAVALNCYICDGNIDTSDCIVDLKKSPPTGCKNDEKFCYTKSVDGKVTRGCATNADVCKDVKDGNCKSCEGDSCNTHSICKYCNSTSDENCALTKVDKSNYYKVCETENTNCIMRINSENKHIERDCNSDKIVCKENDKLCKTCNSSICNTGIFPIDRKLCIKCQDNAKCNAEFNVAGTYCVLYDEKAQCFLNANDTITTRDCFSDAPSDCAEGKCKKCLNTNSCNNEAAKRNQTLQCTICDSKSNEKCLTGADVDNKDCEKELFFYQNDSCYKQTKDGVTYRGCLHDRDLTSLGECNSTNNCNVCSDKGGCNKDTESKTCLNCRSNENADCKKNTDKVKGADCRNLLPNGEVQCFAGTWNNIVIRGCLVDLSPTDQAICNDKKNKQCLICSGNNCNKDAVGAAASIKFATSLFFVTLLLMFVHFK